MLVPGRTRERERERERERNREKYIERERERESDRAPKQNIGMGRLAISGERMKSNLAASCCDELMSFPASTT